MFFYFLLSRWGLFTEACSQFMLHLLILQAAFTHFCRTFQDIMKASLYIGGLVVLLLSSCVTGRQFQELQAEADDCKAKNAALTKANEQLSAQNRELEGMNENLQKSSSALESDTTLLGNSLRHLRNQYDKINELNDILMNKNSSMMSEVTEENRKLLTDLQKAQEELQQQEDALKSLEAELNIKEADLNKISMELEERAKRVDELETLIAQKDAAVNSLKDRVAQALLGFQDKGLTVEQKNGKVYVSLDAKLLFPSGSTVIDNNGKQALIDLAKAIENEADLEVVVEGHTDTDKIRSNNIPSQAMARHFERISAATTY
ncbi:MAG: hypothetical protein AAF193_11245, partial [Bacteroidota bacterium]